WEKRGWDRQAIMRTESRFANPWDGGRFRSPYTVSGVAWAGDRRISKVEVSTDDGHSWSAARLEAELGRLAWRRWAFTLDLAPGTYTLAVRAADGTGTWQDAEERPPHPSGASGYHRIGVTVEAG